ncbi:hypothetical protein MTY66_02750 [Mycolicibacterium sp. TY66]|nr:hypothetical protein MTY66_02750 [Mycolicibacterium sp. TY66]BCJ83689.1 hypothetical protein MTY81_50620 [Mycolicibacterium sp. TY81]
MATEEADADAVTDVPTGDVGADGVDDAHGFMTGYHRQVRVGPLALDGEDVAVAHPAALYAEAHLTRRWLEQGPLHQLEMGLASHLKGAIRRHSFSSDRIQLPLGGTAGSVVGRFRLTQRRIPRTPFRPTARQSVPATPGSDRATFGGRHAATGCVA